MAESGNQDAIETLQAQGFEVALQDTGQLTCERYICRLSRGNLSRGYFGPTQQAALECAAQAVEEGRFET